MFFACIQRWPPARQRLKNCAVCAGARMLATTTACRCRQKYSTVTGCCSSAVQMRAVAAALWGFSFLTAAPLGKLNYLLCMVGFAAFFGPQAARSVRAWIRREQWKRKNRR